MSEKPKVLFLPRWYPNRYDPMPGLFIQRQAEALTKFCDVAVIYVHPDKECPNKIEVDFSEENEVRVLRVYYKPAENPGSGLGRLIGFLRFYRANMKAIHSIRQFSPNIVHAHILTRMGVIAWKAGREFKAPVVISEHWSRYFPENNTYKGWIRKMVTHYLTGKAAALVAVSEHLKEAMLRSGLSNPRFRVIPNVVDTTLFHPDGSSGKGEFKTMVHISCFDDRSKNISGFLRSIKELSSTRQDFRCLLIGAGPDWLDMKEYAGFLRIPEGMVEFPGVVKGSELADLLRQADFSVLSSRYETFATVVIESLACGVPVVSTRVGIAAEMINETNGILVEPANDEAMTRALSQMLDGCGSYDRQRISKEIAGKFDKESVGRQIAALYSEILGSSC